MNRLSILLGLASLGPALPAQATSATWIPRTTVPPVAIASGVVGHSLSHCLATNRVTMFGGVKPGNLYSNGTFEWTGASWLDKTQPLGPSARAYHAATSLFPKPGVLIHGGRATTVDSGTWEWNGTSWAQKATGGPGPRELHALAYDPGRDRVVLFGGTATTAGMGLADTWEWDGNAWSQKVPVTSPPARVGHAMAYDLASGRVVMFGGITSPSTTTSLADTWEWDGVNWLQRTPVSSPQVRAYASMTYDLSRGGLVLHGGRSGSSGAPHADAWTWDSAGNTWKALVPAGVPGPRRDLHGTAYDLARGRIVLFGGYVAYPTQIFYADTWELATAVPASVIGYGAGCPGTAGVPVLGAVGVPRLGSTTFALSLANARPTAPAGLLFAELPENVAVGGGCTLLVSAPFLSVSLTTDAAGGASVPLPVPGATSLLGLELRLQGVVADPLGSLGGGACTTAGLLLVLGT